MTIYLVAVKKGEIETSFGESVFDVIDNATLDGFLIVREIPVHQFPESLRAQWLAVRLGMVREFWTETSSLAEFCVDRRFAAD